MRLTIELDNKYVAIEIGDLEDGDDDTADESVTVTEAEHIVLPFGFQAPPNTGDEEIYDDECDEVEARPEVDRR